MTLHHERLKSGIASLDLRAAKKKSLPLILKTQRAGGFFEEKLFV
jgi:hypothetical protein